MEIRCDCFVKGVKALSRGPTGTVKKLRFLVARLLAKSSSQTSFVHISVNVCAVHLKHFRRAPPPHLLCPHMHRRTSRAPHSTSSVSARQLDAALAPYAFRLQSNRRGCFNHLKLSSNLQVHFISWGVYLIPVLGENPACILHIYGSPTHADRDRDGVKERGWRLERSEREKRYAG